MKVPLSVKIVFSIAAFILAAEAVWETNVRLKLDRTNFIEAARRHGFFYREKNGIPHWYAIKNGKCRQVGSWDFRLNEQWEQF